MATTPAMSWEEWGRTDGLGLAELVRAGKLSRGELAAQAAAGVARVNPRLEAVIEVFDDVLADPGIDRPDPAGALAGVPIFLKDLGSGLKGRRQEAGSALLAGTVLGQTDPLVANYLRAGMIPLGRSTTPEFGLTFDTVTDYRGSLRVSRNPWNLERTPGGSSGGSAAVVAAGVTPISMATDGGGSIRIPASFCGLVGLKPSRGRVAPPFARNEYVSRTSVEGVVTRSVRDTAAVLDYITAGPKGGSFICMAPPAGSYLDAIRTDPAPLRIALSTGDWGRATRTDPEVAERVREVARVLEGLGHHVEEIGDREICAWETLWRGFITGWVGSRLMFKTMAERRGLSEAQLHERLEPMTWRHYVAAQRYSVLDMFAMMDANNTVTRQWGALMTPLRRPALPGDRHPRGQGERAVFAPARRGHRPLDRPPYRRRALHDAGERDGTAGDRVAGRARYGRAADRRAALWRFRARGFVAGTGGAIGAGAGRVVRGGTAGACRRGRVARCVDKSCSRLRKMSTNAAHAKGMCLQMLHLRTPL